MTADGRTVPHACLGHQQLQWSILRCSFLQTKCISVLKRLFSKINGEKNKTKPNKTHNRLESPPWQGGVVAELPHARCWDGAAPAPRPSAAVTLGRRAAREPTVITHICFHLQQLRTGFLASGAAEKHFKTSYFRDSETGKQTKQAKWIYYKE